jgi:hypothetical protein
MKSTRCYYSEPIHKFCNQDLSYILGELARAHAFTIEQNQRNAWEFQIRALRGWLQGVNGHIIFEYTIPRMGKRVDCIIIFEAVIFVIEFKVGASKYERQSINQVVDYVLDLKNFHEKSHHKYIIPVLICPEAKDTDWNFEFYEDRTAKPILTNGSSLRDMFDSTPSIKEEPINVFEWIGSIYTPTPTIIEAAQLLYQNHRVEEISRSDAGAYNLTQTTKTISNIIQHSKTNHKKSICFLTGVPGAGKTLAGLNIANCWHGEENSEHAVFLSGNGPLVDVLCEALAKNDVKASIEKGMEANVSNSRRKAKTFIRNIHHFRDDGLGSCGPPLEHVVIFDEAQRAWDQKQTSSFMKNKKGIFSFNQSEPEFLISLMDRHVDWATIICLVGEGQEINTGEAGIQEWFNALEKSFPNWSIYTSSRFSDHEYTKHQKEYSSYLLERTNFVNGLHLATSIRSFRSENVAAFVETILNCDVNKARQLHQEFEHDYPIVVTRCLESAKKWLKLKARGTERYGLIASSGAIRLKPHGIYVKNKIDPKNWFLNDESDIRSSYYLEDVATEFDVQGLELDWTCLAWDADLHHDGTNWIMKSFRGTSWQNINDESMKLYLKNSYRVLLSRARQGMVIFIPKGDDSDKTRQKIFYDHTYSYLVSIGIKGI